MGLFEIPSHHASAIRAGQPRPEQGGVWRGRRACSLVLRHGLSLCHSHAFQSSVLDGASWFDPSISHVVLEAAANYQSGETKVAGKDYGLTSREAQILKLITEGYSNNEIANQLFVSINTTKAHVASILQKLEVDDRLQAALKALKERLV